MIENPFQNKLLNSEKILWTGQPARGLLFTPRDAFLIPFSLLWCGFAIFWTFTATHGGAPGFFTLWGMMFVCIGVYFVAGRFVVDAFIRRNMHYAVTDHRILISRSAPFGKFTAINIAALSDINITERSDGRGTIVLGQPVSTWGNRRSGSMTPALDPTPQFLGIENAQRVFNLLQEAINRAKS